MARRVGARGRSRLEARGHRRCATSSPTPSFRNAMVAARGVRRLDEPDPAHARDRARRRPARPTVDDWTRVNRQVPRLVDALPNGPQGHPTVQVFLAGGVPEVMLHLRRAGLLETGRADGQRARRSARCSTGGSSPSGAPTLRDAAHRSATASTPTTSSWTRTARASAASPRPSRFPRAISRRTARSSRARRSTRASWTPTASTARPARRASSHREGGDRRRSRARRASRPGDVLVLMLPRADGLGHGGDLTRSPSALQLPRLRQARGGDHRRPLQRRLDRRVHRPRDAGGAGRRTDRQAPRRRPDRDRRSTA